MQKEGRRDFDSAAARWDEEPRRVKLAQDIVSTIRKELPLNSRMEALDYGCGSGLVTLGLQPFVKKITGADSSRGMLEVLNRKIQELRFPNVDSKLIDLEEQERLKLSYDLIVSAMTMHHVDDVAALIAALARSLKPGGWLAIADLQTEDGGFHEDPTGVLHFGFDREYLRSEFSRNGLTDVRVVTAATIEKPGGGEVRRYPVLLCLGRRQG